ncbi:MAG TPA: hypothetical protein VH475_15420, partial [Tepidisphaeraceae bacterium]|jgi:tetratricopeptide (TPR) repeat protein
MSPQPARVAPARRKWPYYCTALTLAAAAGAFLWSRAPVPAFQKIVVRLPLVGDEIVAALDREPPDPAARVNAVLEGTADRQGDRVRVVAELRREDGHRYWTRTFDRPLNEIVLEVAAAVAPGVRKRATRHKASVVAYERYLDGRGHFARNDFANALESFDAATASDGDFALAFAWQAIAAEQLAEQGSRRPNELLPGARDAAERALALDSALPEAHLALGIVKLQYDWDWDQARSELERARALSPRDARVAWWYRRWQAAMNQAPAPPLDVPDADSARHLLAEADDLRSQKYVTPVTFALAAAAAHDTESLFRWLDAAYDERCVQLPYLLRNPALPQSDPRLLELIRRLKLPTVQ